MKRDSIRSRTAALLDRKIDFPVLATASALWDRLLQDRLALTASSLTYTTVLALVPLFTVVLSVFTVFPIFGEMEGMLQQWLLESLIPESIAGNVMGYLTEFSSKASQLGLMGVGGLAVTAVLLMLTIDKTLNQIWRATDKRPLGQRVLVYWAALTLGPLITAASLAITSYALTASQGWLPDIPAGTDFALAVLQFALMTGGIALLYRFVPNRPVMWQHALTGALFVTIAIGVAKWGLGVYLGYSQKYANIYGAFAVVPILLLWIYLGWLIVLSGAVIAAYLPTASTGVARRRSDTGWEFQLAVEIMRALDRARTVVPRGLTVPQLARHLRADVLDMVPVLQALRDMDWVGQLATRRENEEPRLILLFDPARQGLVPLVERFLIPAGHPVLQRWQGRPLAAIKVGDVLA